VRASHARVCAASLLCYAPRIAWEHSLTSNPKSFAPGAYDQMLAGHGSSFFSAFTQFAADTAEWRSANSPFAEGASFPDMVRGRTTDGATVVLKPNTDGAYWLDDALDLSGIRSDPTFTYRGPFMVATDDLLALSPGATMPPKSRPFSPVEDAPAATATSPTMAIYGTHRRT